MRRLAPAILAAGLALVLPALAQARAPKPPKQVYDAVAKVLKDGGADVADPDAPTGVDVTTPPPDMFTPVDINGDGKPDWKVDYAAAPNPSLFCGSGGCEVELWASQPGGGWSKVMDELVRASTVTRTAGVTRLEVDFHGTVCGGSGVDPCGRAYRWDEDTGWVATPTADGHTWLYGGPVELNLYNRQDLPADVNAAFDRIQALCPEGGGDTERQTWSSFRIPDINGDGQGDWVVGGAYDACAVSGADPNLVLPVIVLVSGPGGGFSEAYAKPGMAFGIDIGQHPAAFYAIPPNTFCGDADGALDKPCGQRLRWDAASGKLAP